MDFSFIGTLTLFFTFVLILVAIILPKKNKRPSSQLNGLSPTPKRITLANIIAGYFLMDYIPLSKLQLLFVLLAISGALFIAGNNLLAGVCLIALSVVVVIIDVKNKLNHSADYQTINKRGYNRFGMSGYIALAICCEFMGLYFIEQPHFGYTLMLLGIIFIIKEISDKVKSS